MLKAITLLFSLTHSLYPVQLLYPSFQISPLSLAFINLSTFCHVLYWNFICLVEFSITHPTWSVKTRSWTLNMPMTDVIKMKERIGEWDKLTTWCLKSLKWSLIDVGPAEFTYSEGVFSELKRPGHKEVWSLIRVGKVLNQGILFILSMELVLFHPLN